MTDLLNALLESSNDEHAMAQKEINDHILRKAYGDDAARQRRTYFLERQDKAGQ